MDTTISTPYPGSLSTWTVQNAVSGLKMHTQSDLLAIHILFSTENQMVCHHYSVLGFEINLSFRKDV